MYVQNIEDKIVDKIKKCGRGKLYFTSDFILYGTSKSVAKALERLTEKHSLLRIARGLYYYPKIEKKLGLGVVYPGIDQIAECIAQRDEARIVPTGVHALNILGLSTQVPVNYIYFTDGNPKTINLENGRKIRFKRTALKNLAYQNKTLMLIVFALKEIGQQHVTEEHLAQIRTILSKIPRQTVLSDLRLMPAWIVTLIKRMNEA